MILQKMITRIVIALILGAAVLSIILLGHHSLSVFVFLAEAAVFRELMNVRRISAKENNLPWFRSLHWAIFIIVTFYMHGGLCFSMKPDTSIYNLQWLFPGYTKWLLHFHSYISIMAYCCILMLLVLSFRRSTISYQIRQVAWTIFILFIVVFQTRAIIYNIFNGLFWFLLPVSLVITNDSMAYFSGLLLGRRVLVNWRFLDLSPRKTWEGFIGGGICTVIFGYFLSGWLSQSAYLICPYNDHQCVVREMFIPQDIPLPNWMSQITQFEFIHCAPVQLHSFILSLFASLVAPFGGFLASAIKRAYKLKDFDNILPGHGGFTDRFDCQFIMGLFTWMYCSQFLYNNAIDVFHKVIKLDEDLQNEFYSQLQQHITLNS